MKKVPVFLIKGFRTATYGEARAESIPEVNNGIVKTPSDQLENWADETNLAGGQDQTRMPHHHIGENGVHHCSHATESGRMIKHPGSDYPVWISEKELIARKSQLLHQLENNYEQPAWTRQEIRRLIGLDD